MEAGLLAQHVVVAAAVVASGVYVIRTRFPKQTRRALGRLALKLVDSRHPGLQQLGRRLAPAPTHRPCGSCDGCDA